MLYRRYEIILPTQLNDGTPVQPALLLMTARELATRFGGASLLPESLPGFWVQQGCEFEERNLRLFVDVEDTQENAAFFERFKQTLKDRFRQIDIWIVSYEIRIT